MFSKFAEAFRLLWNHLGLFTAIILTVWLPGNILINYMVYHADEASDVGVVKLGMWRA